MMANDVLWTFRHTYLAPFTGHAVPRTSGTGRTVHPDPSRSESSQDPRVPGLPVRGGVLG